MNILSDEYKPQVTKMPLSIILQKNTYETTDNSQILLNKILFVSVVLLALNIAIAVCSDLSSLEDNKN